MVLRKGLGWVTLAIVASSAVFAGTSVAEASSLTLSFKNIGGNSNVSGSEFKVTVSDLGGNKARFTFENSGPAGSSITGIWFYDGAILGNTATILDAPHSTATGKFVENSGSPGNLPGGNPYGLSNSTKEFYSSSQGSTGIYVGEVLSIDIEYDGTFADVIAALDSGLDKDKSNNKFQSGDLVIGIEVQSLPNGKSDQFITSNITAIPLPAPVWMGLAGLCGVVVLRRRLSN